MKLVVVAALGPVEVVAPLAGAWIETGQHGPGSTSKSVAPLAGAWIETRKALYYLL